MPRSGPSGTYTLPPIYLAIPGTTIVVDQHNTPLQDIANTFNTVQPIDYGGTGADNAADALANLGGASGAANEYTTATGTATAVVVDPSTAIPTLVSGRFVTWTAIADLTVGTGVTINVSGLGVRKLVKATDGGIERALAPGDMVTGGKYMAVYLSTLDSGTGAWVLVNPTPFYGSVRNRIVNPAMQISQENNNTSGTTNGYYAADQFAMYRVTSAGTFTAQRVQSRTPKGSLDRFRTTITAADASLAAGEYLTINQNIEGNEVADFQYGLSTAKQAVLTFGWKSPAGTYSVSIKNAALNRSYVAQFTPTAANTDEYITLVIPGDTTGTWLTDTGIGLSLDFTIAAGSTFQASGAGWSAGNFLGLASNTNGAGTISNVFELFDVQLCLDPDNTGLAPAWELPDYDDTLRQCQRYCWRLSSTANVAPNICMAFTRNSTNMFATLNNPVPMRSIPTMVAASGTDYFLYSSQGDFLFTTVTLNQGGIYSNKITASISGATAGQGGELLFGTSAGTSAYLFFNARM